MITNRRRLHDFWSSYLHWREAASKPRYMFIVVKPFKSFIISYLYIFPHQHIYQLVHCYHIFSVRPSNKMRRGLKNATSKCPFVFYFQVAFLQRSSILKTQFNVLLSFQSTPYTSKPPVSRESKLACPALQMGQETRRFASDQDAAS